MQQDFYTILEVSETASDDEIKKSYRRLAMKHHPDRNPGDKAAEERFKQINEAYAVLGDGSKRIEYDQMRKFGAGHPGGQSRQGFQEFHFNFGGGFPNLDDMIRQMFEQQGFGGPFGHQQPRKNRDLQITVEISLEEAFTGKDVPIAFKADGQDVNIVVRIPSGVTNGMRLRFQGHGDRTIPNLPPGDLYVTIAILPHHLFRRDGPHLHCDVRVDAISAMVGSTASIRCIDGSSISLTIPQGSQNGTSLRVREKGMPMHNNAKQLGDLYVNLLVEVPRDLSDSHMADMRRILNERQGNVS